MNSRSWSHDTKPNIRSVALDIIRSRKRKASTWGHKLASVWPAGLCQRELVSSSRVVDFRKYGTMRNLQTLQWRHNGRDRISHHQPHDCLLNRFFRRRSKKTSKRRATGFCAGNSPETGQFPAQMASNAENASIWWCHHDSTCIFTRFRLWAQELFVNSEVYRWRALRKISKRQDTW